MDATTNTEDVKHALETSIGNQQERKYKIGQLRPGPFNTQVVTVQTGKEEAEELVNGRVLHVRMVTCTVEKHIKLERCYKCWTHGHLATHCNGPDRSKLYWKCRKVGHAGVQCKDEDWCPICEESGHRAKSGRCVEFRLALRIERKREYEKRLSAGRGETLRLDAF